MDSSLPGWVCVATIVVLFVLPMWAYTLFAERRGRRARAEALAAGRMEPVTIQPMVDLSVCMGSGACVTACPEHVFSVLENQAVAVNMASCIGHGTCVTACPVGAIELVFGSEARGVDLPHVGPDFQTNVPGLYVAGELGGMGLIASAANQGRQAATNALASLRSVPGQVDLLIVGAGPAGIAAAAAAKVAKRSYAVIEQEELGGAVRHYPRKKLVFTQPMYIPGYPVVNLSTLRKEELVALFDDVVRQVGLEIATQERVDSVVPVEDGGFFVTTSRRTLSARRVILAIGRRGTPRKLDVPGEELQKVAYSLLEPEHFRHEHLLVVGGGDSAVEAAIALAEQPGNRVSLSYRGATINRPKPKNLERLEKARESGAVELLLGSKVTSIAKDRVQLELGGEEIVRPNDQVFVMVGGVLPVGLLEEAGIRIETHHGRKITAKAAPKPRDPAPARVEAQRRAPAPLDVRAASLPPVGELGEDSTTPRAPRGEPTIRLGPVEDEVTVQLVGDLHPPEVEDDRARAWACAGRGEVGVGVSVLVQRLAALAGRTDVAPESVAGVLTDLVALEGLLGDPVSALQHADAAEPIVAGLPHHAASAKVRRAEIAWSLGMPDQAQATLADIDWELAEVAGGAGIDGVRVDAARLWCRIGQPEVALGLLGDLGRDDASEAAAVRAVALAPVRPDEAEQHLGALAIGAAPPLQQARVRLDVAAAQAALGDAPAARRTIKAGLKAIQRGDARGLRLELALALLRLGADEATHASVLRTVQALAQTLPGPLAASLLARSATSTAPRSVG